MTAAESGDAESMYQSASLQNSDEIWGKPSSGTGLPVVPGSLRRMRG